MQTNEQERRMTLHVDGAWRQLAGEELERELNRQRINIHPEAVIHPMARIGAHTIISGGAMIEAGATVGK